MTRIDRVKTIARKAPIVMNSAKILNEKYENKELTEDETYVEMIRFAKGGNFISYWTDIDEYLSKEYENEEWFWLIRKVSNTMNNLQSN